MDSNSQLIINQNTQLQQSQKLYDVQAWLSLPDTFISGLPEVKLTGPATIKFDGEEMNLKEFVEKGWMVYLREYLQHMNLCRTMGPIGRTYAVEKLNYNDFNIAFEVWKRTELQTAKKQLRDELAYDGNSSTELAEKFIEILTGKKDRGDVGALMHCIWQAKRKMNGLRTGWEMMLVLYGGTHGSGKSTSLEALLEPVKMFTVSMTLSDLTDERWRALLSENIAVMLSELSGADRASMEELKRLITEPHIAYRPMRTNNIVHIKQLCTFFGSSNREISEVLHDESMRRFYQLNTAEVIDKRAVWKIDMIALWKSVDENRELGYFEEYKDDLMKNRHMIEKGEPFMQWIEDVEMIVDDKACAEVQELYNNYREYMEKSGYRYIPTLNSFSQMMKRKGFKNKRHMVNNGPITKQFTFYYFNEGAHIVSALAPQLKVKPIKNKDGSIFEPLL